MKTLTKIGSLKKHLPEPIRRLIKSLYKVKRREEIKIDKELLQGIVEFYNETNDFKITYKEGVMLCKLGKKLMADLWNILDPKTEEGNKEILSYLSIWIV